MIKTTTIKQRGEQRLGARKGGEGIRVHNSNLEHVTSLQPTMFCEITSSKVLQFSSSSTMAPTLLYHVVLE